jgi:hypothetical protein
MPEWIYFLRVRRLKRFTFFSVSIPKLLLQRETKNPKILELAAEFEYWIKQGYLIHFIFVSTGVADQKVAALVEKFNGAKHKANVKFDVWDISGLRDEYVSVQSIEEKYPDNVVLTLASGHFMQPDGSLSNLTFAIRGTALKELALEHKDSLFNWNIRRFLGRKGEVNAGLTETLSNHPEHFYYFNNGISALCEEFHFEPKSKKLQITKLQVVNGAQTVGAIRYANSEQLKNVLVLVKLTAVRHAHRETGIAASLIKTNNTQNTLRAPDFRSNDKIQLWLEQKFKSTKPRGELPQIAYGRKRPYPRSSAAQSVLKLQDLGKIRYAWYHDPRIPISDPAKLFLLPEEGGLYGFSFGSDGELVDIWSDDQFRMSLLAIHAFWKIESLLEELQANAELRQISRLKYYGLKLFKRYCDRVIVEDRVASFEDLFAFGGKFNSFFDRSMKVISRTLSRSYQDMLSKEEGTAFSLPRDPKVWAAIERRFEDNLSLIRDIEG